MGLGVFGKLPARGDFVTRAIAPEVLGFWEGWLEQVTGGARHHLGEAWAQAYEGSPVWRFWIGPGVFGHAIAGALAASFDKVGRPFPLTLVLSGAGAAHPVPPLSDPMAEWYGALEGALRTATSAKFDGDLDAVLAALPAPSAAPCARGEDRRNAFFAYGEHGLGQMLADVREHDHQLAAARRSYWWTAGTAVVGPGMLAMDGMPDATGFAAMLRGFGPAAGPRPAAAAGPGGGRGPREPIGKAGAGATAAAREAPEGSVEDRAGDHAWAEMNTGDAAESPFGGPGEAWTRPGLAAGDMPDGDAAPAPERAGDGQGRPGDTLPAAPAPHRTGADGGVPDQRPGRPLPAPRTGTAGGAGQDSPRPASAPRRAAFVPDGAEGPVIDVSMARQDEEEAGGAAAERDGKHGGAVGATAPRADTAAPGAIETEAAAMAPGAPEGEDSPFGPGAAEAGAGRPGLRGLFARRNRGKD